MAIVKKQRFNSLEYVRPGYKEYLDLNKRIKYLKNQLKDALLNTKITFLVKHWRTGQYIKVAVYTYNRNGKSDKRIRIISASKYDIKNFKENTQLDVSLVKLISEVYDLQEQLKKLMLENNIYPYRLGKRGLKK